jgi:hypothetical protein
MRENSRIRFNPVTKEIEIEGSESFVKIYFKKLQVMVFGLAEKTVAAKKEPKPVKGAPVKTDKKELKLVNYPTHRAGHLKNLMRGLHPPYPRSAFIPVHWTGYSAGGFHKGTSSEKGDEERTRRKNGHQYRYGRRAYPR